MLDAGRRNEYAGLINDSGHHLLAGHQRHSRHVENRDRQFRDHAGAVRAGAGRLPAAAIFWRCGRARRASRWTKLRRGDLPDMIADKRALNQILLNLLSNAIRFTDRGGKVTIGARARGRQHHLHRRGQRRRHQRRGSGAGRRAVFSGARLLRPPPRRHRSRSVHRQRPGAVAWRRDRHPQPARRGHRASACACRSIASARGRRSGSADRRSRRLPTSYLARSAAERSAAQPASRGAQHAAALGRNSGEEKCLSGVTISRRAAVRAPPASPVRIDRFAAVGESRAASGRLRSRSSAPSPRVLSSSSMPFFCNPARTRRRSLPIRPPPPPQRRQNRASAAVMTTRRPADSTVRDGRRRLRTPATRSRGATIRSPTSSVHPSRRHRASLAVQRVLSEFGYGQMRPSGTLDEPTSAAIEKFESDAQFAGHRAAFRPAAAASFPP